MQQKIEFYYSPSFIIMNAHFSISCKDEDEMSLVHESELAVCYGLESPQERFGFQSILNDHRNKIDKIAPDIWKKVRWYINDYDFLVKDPIINRAFYKYWEIINEFELFEHYQSDDTIFHGAEAPGGFIQGSNIYLQLENRMREQKVKPKNIVDEDGFTMVKPKKKMTPRLYKIFTISLNKDLPKYRTYNLPSYNKGIMNKNVLVSYGKDNTGDINNLENVFYIDNLAKKQSNNGGFYLISSDGGFDEGNDFNNKEQLHYFLILNEIFSAVYLQKPGGSYILKVFDIFTETSVHLLYLLNTLYSEVYIYKPKTSRPTNSEKYIVCKGFHDNSEYRTQVIRLLQVLSASLRKHPQQYAAFKLFRQVPNSFMNKIKECNQALLTRQCNYLEKAILLCEDSAFITNYETALDNSIERRRMVFKNWESTYNLDSYVPS